MTDCAAEFPEDWFDEAKLFNEKHDPTLKLLWDQRIAAAIETQGLDPQRRSAQAGFSGIAATKAEGKRRRTANQAMASDATSRFTSKRTKAHLSCRPERQARYCIGLIFERGGGGGQFETMRLSKCSLQTRHLAVFAFPSANFSSRWHFRRPRLAVRPYIFIVPLIVTGILNQTAYRLFTSLLLRSPYRWLAACCSRFFIGVHWFRT